MLMKHKIFFYTIGLGIIFSSCRKPDTRIFDAAKPFQSLILQIKIKGIPIDDSTLAHTTMYYYDHRRYVDNPGDIKQGDKTIYDDKSLMTLAGGNLTGLGFIYSPYISPVSAQGISNTFYLKFPDGDVDTITLVASSVSNEQAKKELCYCTAPIRTVSYNGKVLPVDSSFLETYGRIVYRTDKP